jgi:small subunit ribosomal protein S2
MKEVTIEQMLAAGVHFGHQKARWNPRMAPFIFGQKEGVHIIDLQKTEEKLAEALKFVGEVVSSGKKILFIGTKRQAKEPTKKSAESCGMPYVVERWLGGTFTNFGTVKKQIKKLKDLKEKEKSGELSKYTKKEQLLFKEEIRRLEKLFGGIADLDNFPSAIFVVDITHDSIPVREAQKVSIPIVALVDTNADPGKVDYPIPANDDAIKSIELMCNIIAEKIKESKKEQKVLAPKEKQEKEEETKKSIKK